MPISTNDLPTSFPIAEPPRVSAHLPGIPGKLRDRPEDFVVEEIPAYEPSGEGEHLFVHFEKRELNTKEAVARIAGALGLDPRQCGWAGLKDRWAVTTQWASFAGGDPGRAMDLTIPNLKVLAAVPHRHKLRTGHLKGNRFTLRIRGAGPHEKEAREAFDLLAQLGVPNYFGTQRFGAEGHNVTRACAWLLEGGRPPKSRFDRKLLVSVLQSVIFNEVAGRRVERGLLSVPLAGDLLKKEDTGGLFTTEDLNEATERVARWEVSPTGPMVGVKMRRPEHEAATFEAAVEEAFGVTDEVLSRFARFGEGTRRALRIRPAEVEISVEEDDLLVGFVLPKGTYATVVMEEVLQAPTA